jgi:hypothetical protein
MGERTPEPRESPLDRTLSNWFGDSPSVNEYSIFASPDRPPATRCSPRNRDLKRAPVRTSSAAVFGTTANFSR